MKIIFSDHAEETMSKRGATREEAEEAIAKGTWRTAKLNRKEAHLIFPYNTIWNSIRYAYKQVNPIFIQEDDIITVITVYVFYSN